MPKKKIVKKPRPRKWNRRNKPAWRKRLDKYDKVSPPSDYYYD